MATILVMCDGGVTGLLASAAAGLKVATGPRGAVAKAVICGPTEHHWKAAAIQAAEFGLEIEPYRITNGKQSLDPWVQDLVESALLARQSGEVGSGREVVWPIGPEGREVDVAFSARILTAATLVSQLVALTGSEPDPVQVRAPYADLSEDQVADLVLDLDLPIWTCWWMAAAEFGEAEVRARATFERERWRAALKRAGWAGSLEAKAAVHVKPMVPNPPAKVHGGQA